jgi:dihydrofolate reductase
MNDERVRCAVFVATSVDGYIARADGAIDWLEAANATIPAGEDCGYDEFYAGVDALVMGRRTYELARTFDRWPYEGKPVVVLSRTMRSLTADAPDGVRLSTESPAALVARLEREGRRHVYVDGGLTVQSFLAAGLIDAITVTTIPVLLGSGLRLFGALPRDIALERIATRAYDFGFVQTTWMVLRPERSA